MLWLQLVNQNIMVTGRTYWHFEKLANFHCNQPENQILTNHPIKARWCCNGINWSSFIKEIEPQMQQLPKEPNISTCISQFSNILKSSASLHVGRIKLSKKPKPWINPPVWAKICHHNCLHLTIHQNQQEWISGCWEANVAINEAKANSWNNLLHSSVSNADKSDIWKVIWGLNSTPDTNSPNEALSHNDLTITNTKSKANIFINHYASVSKLHMTKEDCGLSRLFKKHLNAPSVENNRFTSINMSELLSAIQKVKCKGAAGPDSIPLTFLKSLGPLALQELLSIFNASFHLADFPLVKRVVIIIPLLKAGKLPSDVASFRPISYTSCIVKLLELIISDWLYDIAKSNNLFSRLQSGFNIGRSCEDQILRVV